MTEEFRILGKNTIRFDLAAGGNYYLERPPRSMTSVLMREEVLSILSRLPLGIRPHVLKTGLSVITLEFNIWGTTDTDMEDREHDLIETLVEGALWIETQMQRGIQAQLRYKSSGAVGTSYKTIFYGDLDEADARHVLGGMIKGHRLEKLKLILYCEPYWHADAVTNLVNGLTRYNHDDGDANHDNYVAIAGANIGGDVPAPIYIRVRPVAQELLTLRVFARYKGTVANFVSAYEAEGATNRSNWADAAPAQPNCSNGNCVSNNTNTSGYVYWTVAANKPDQEGLFHLFARVRTNDKDNVRFRARLTNATGLDLIIGQWKAVDENNVWKLLDLGQFKIETPYGMVRDDWRWYVGYSKPALSTADLDWLFVAPVGEGIALLLDVPPVGSAVPIADEFTWRGTHDFVEAYDYNQAAPRYAQPLTPRGFRPEPTLMPQKNTRLLFSVDTDSPGGLRQNDVHEPAGAERFTIYVDYLPQFISPLE